MGVYFVLSKVQHARGQPWLVTAIDAGRISIYAEHVIFFYHTVYRP